MKFLCIFAHVITDACKHGYMFIKALSTVEAGPANSLEVHKGASHIFCVLSESIKLDSPPLPDFVPVHARLQFAQSARKGGAQYRRIPDSRFPPAVSRACWICSVATKSGPLAEAEDCFGGGEAQSRRSQRARLWAPGGGVRATRVRDRLGARRHLQPPASVYQQTAIAQQLCIPTR